MLQTITASQAPAAVGPYAHAILAGDFLFTSGQIPLDLNGQVVPGGIEEQTKQVFSNLQAVLAEAGFTLNDVVKTTVFLQDMNDFAKMNEVYATYFNEHKPARSTVEAARLPKDVKVEIELVAYKKIIKKFEL